MLWSRPPKNPSSGILSVSSSASASHELAVVHHHRVELVGEQQPCLQRPTAAETPADAADARCERVLLEILVSLAQVGTRGIRLRDELGHQSLRFLRRGGGLAVVEVDGERDVTFAGEAPRGGLDVVVEPPPLVDHDDSGQAARPRRAASRGTRRDCVSAPPRMRESCSSSGTFGGSSANGDGDGESCACSAAVACTASAAAPFG